MKKGLDLNSSQSGYVEIDFSNIANQSNSQMPQFDTLGNMMSNLGSLCEKVSLITIDLLGNACL